MFKNTPEAERYEPVDTSNTLHGENVKMSEQFLSVITPVILTYNEAPNIARTLSKLHWAKEVVVLDSGSIDQTLEILGSFDNVRYVYRPFDTHANQWNFAIKETGISTEWVLALDADYFLTDSLVAEINELNPSHGVAGYVTEFIFCVFGKPLHGSLYPPVTTLYRQELGTYVQDGHTQRLVLSGAVQHLKAKIMHDDRKSLARWLSSQARYAIQESALLLVTPWSKLKLQDKIRRLIIIAPWLVPLYCLTVGRGLMDGKAGVYYALQRGVAESILSIQLIETWLRPSGDANH